MLGGAQSLTGRSDRFWLANAILDQISSLLTMKQRRLNIQFGFQNLTLGDFFYCMKTLVKFFSFIQFFV